ncbi:hypothetical protein E2C01_079410 [Portunus trituberculatus]|uniref:Uncharacterized protein n=1 Tax=Portunus trituberculatus TaxID=210409 RepID=A0A5B7IQ91_PORTR|nr:hypothetical protein [Portunus trituberculatus]
MLLHPSFSAAAPREISERLHAGSLLFLNNCGKIDSLTPARALHASPLASHSVLWAQLDEEGSLQPGALVLTRARLKFMDCAGYWSQISLMKQRTINFQCPLH